jgi:hypothetical protein
MKIKVRKIVEEVKTEYDENTKKYFKYKVQYENGYVEELEINPMDVTAFSTNKHVRLIGVDKKLYPLTLKSWKQAKKELSNLGILSQLNYSRAN